MIVSQRQATEAFKWIQKAAQNGSENSELGDAIYQSGQVCNSLSAGDFYLKQARVKSIETAHPDDSDHLVFDCDFRMEQKKASHENK